MWLSAAGRGAELREDVGHLEGAADGVSGAVDPGLALLDGLDGEHAEGDGHTGLDPGKLQAYKKKLSVKVGKGQLFVRARDRAKNFSPWRKVR